MSAALFPAETADLLWHFNEAEGEIKRLRSTFPDEARLKAEGEIGEVRGVESWVDHFGNRHRADKSGLWCGAIEPNETKPTPLSVEIGEEAMAAAARDNRISLALTGADASSAHTRWSCSEPPSQVLRLCFREPLTSPKAAFDAASGRVQRMLVLAGGNKVDRERGQLAAIAARAQQERGPGNLAHLVAAAAEAHAGARTRLDVGRFIDKLGTRLQQAKATPADRLLQRRLADGCELLQVAALELYRRSVVRVPVLVQQRARAREVA